VPKLHFPGGALIGCTAGFMNVPKIKGTHTAMKSAIVAAESAAEALKDSGSSSSSAPPIDLISYEENLKKSWLWEELTQVRNIRPSFGTSLGLYGGVLYSGLDTFVLRGKVPWTLKHHDKKDSDTLVPAKDAQRIVYPKPDGKLTFELLENVARTGTC
jgi:electron-transferring-flavoprotein dehydrogenase